MTVKALRGVRVPDARKLLLGLANVVEGRSYGMPSFLLNRRFFAPLPRRRYGSRSPAGDDRRARGLDGARPTSVLLHRALSKLSSGADSPGRGTGRALDRCRDRVVAPCRRSATGSSTQEAGGPQEALMTFQCIST